MRRTTDTSPADGGDAASRAPDAGLLAKGLLIRAVEERLLGLFAEGKLSGTIHTCIGQELAAVAVARALGPGDCVFTNHRGHGHYLARTDDVDGLVAEIMGRATGPCGGRGGSQHLAAEGFFASGVQGGLVPVAAGVALAQKLRGDGCVSVAFIGDGTLGEGAVYEALNIASAWGLPLLVVLEDNGYAQSTHQRQTLAGDVATRAAAFGIASDRGDTWSPGALVEKARAAVGHVRARSSPFLLHVDTYRLMAHSKGDDDRSPSEVASYWARDPLALFARDHPEDAAQCAVATRVRVERAVALAEAAPFCAATSSDEEVPPRHDLRWEETRIGGDERFASRVHAGLRRALANDARVVLLGEDVEAPYGGAFKVTRDLSVEFPGRVRNTPISEAAIVGVGTGLALAGLRPVVEIMFGDFLALAADALVNHASKLRYASNDRASVPLVVRTPMGGGRGYGPTHSQSLEKHFLGLAGTRVVALHARYDPAALYDDVFAALDRPTLVIENKQLYATRLAGEPPAGFVLEHAGAPFPTTRLRPASRPELTILCYGGMLAEAEAAAGRLFDEAEIAAEIVCPTLLYPFDPWPLVASIASSGHLLVVEEGSTFAGFGAEAIAQVHESAPGLLRRVLRVGPPRHPIPASAPLERAVLPGARRIVAAARELAGT